MRRIGVAIGLAFAVVLLAGCGGSDTSAAGEADEVTVAVAALDPGEVLVDGEGMTLYLFDSDPEGESACTDGCAETWPPLVGTPTAGEDVDAGLLGTIERPDGTTQATYGGHPLYRYAPDDAPGSVAGQGVGEVWWLVGPDGSAIRGPAGEASSPADDAVGPAY